MKDVTESVSKKIVVMALLVVAVIILSVFSFSENAEESEPIIKPVHVITVYEEEEPMGLDYFGMIEPAVQKQLSFKMPGKLSSLSVAEGDVVSTGQTLASIENADLQRAVEAAGNNMESAKSAYDFASDNYEKLQQLQQAGGVSVQELDQARLDRDSRKTTYENARIDYDNRKTMVGDSVIRADFNGVVAKVFYERGEMVPAAYPVILLHSPDNIIRVGISQQDIQSIDQNTKVYVTISGHQYQASVNSISPLPDPATRTYAVELEINEHVSQMMPLGSMVNVSFLTGAKKAIYIPLSIIANDGRDFVYLVDQDQRAEKRIIELGQVKNTEVQVFGLQDGDRVISEGFRNINDGEQVKVKE